MPSPQKSIKKRIKILMETKKPNQITEAEQTTSRNDTRESKHVVRESNSTAVTILRVTAVLGLVAVALCCGFDYESTDGLKIHISRAPFIR